MVGSSQSYDMFEQEDFAEISDLKNQIDCYGIIHHNDFAEFNIDSEVLDKPDTGFDI